MAATNLTDILLLCLITSIAIGILLYFLIPVVAMWMFFNGMIKHERLRELDDTD